MNGTAGQKEIFGTGDVLAKGSIRGLCGCVCAKFLALQGRGDFWRRVLRIPSGERRGNENDDGVHTSNFDAFENLEGPSAFDRPPNLSLRVSRTSNCAVWPMQEVTITCVTEITAPFRLLSNHPIVNCPLKLAARAAQFLWGERGAAAEAVAGNEDNL